MEEGQGGLEGRPLLAEAQQKVQEVGLLKDAGATTSIISSRLATASFTKGHTRSTGWSSGE
jgi:hypothetical protein